MTRALIAAIVAFFVAPAASAQVKYPPRPETSEVHIRFRIRADRDERVRQYRALETYLRKLQFIPNPHEDEDLDILDPAVEQFVGKIPTANVVAILNDARVRTVLFHPVGYIIPDTPDKLVNVRIGIPLQLQPTAQQTFHSQVVAQLAKLGFREAIGYDTRGYSLVRGGIPPANVFRLLKDLRREPAGWFLPDQPPEDLPLPLQDQLPVRWVEILPEADLAPFTPPTITPIRTRVSPDLRAVLDDAGAAEKPLRVELVMDSRLDFGTIDLIRTRLRVSYPGAAVDGIVGNILAVQLTRAADVDRLVVEPRVVSARLARAAVEPGAQPALPADILTTSHLSELHRLGYRGKGRRVVVIGSDFTGAIAQFGKELPASARLIDLTTELSPLLRPLPAAAEPSPAGLAAAKAVATAAPDADLTLVRVDPAAFFQLLSIARFAAGSREYTEAMQSRLTELSVEGDLLRQRYAEAVEEYRLAFQNQSDEPGPATRRMTARAVVVALQEQQTELATRVKRFNEFRETVLALVGTDVVVNTLTWESGYGLDGLSEVSRVIDTTCAGEATPLPRSRSATRPRYPLRPLWVQSASSSIGSVWDGPYRDINADGVMEFTPPTAPIPAGEWTRQLNFLGTLAPDGKTADDLPAGVRLRLTIQWREPHNADVYGGVTAIFPLDLRVLRQLDPAGEKRASDELDEVARSLGGPYQVVKEASYGIYEQTVEFAVPAAGRYALRIEGRQGFDPILPVLKQGIEINPRLIAEFVSSPVATGRPVFRSSAPRNVGVGIPGDAKAALTVGNAASGDHLTTGGVGLALLGKPDLFLTEKPAAGEPKGGSAAATGFVAGMAAAVMGTGVDPSDVIRTPGLSRGGAVVLPEGWFRYVRPLR